mgnify:FL=1
MEETNISQEQNPLGTAPVGGLIGKFAIPAIISMLVSALYNIVDQIFIGQGVGMLGNAATNVAFPVTTIATALALLLGIGGASNYNLEMGAGREKKASSIAGTALSTLVITGVILAVGRIVGETAALMYTAGTVAGIPANIMGSARTLAVHMYVLTNEGLYTNQSYATAVVLLGIVVLINALSGFIAKKITGKGIG